MEETLVLVHVVSIREVLKTQVRFENIADFPPRGQNTRSPSHMPQGPLPSRALQQHRLRPTHQSQWFVLHACAREKRSWLQFQEGKMQAFKFGEWLRERYGDFLNVYHHEEVEAWASKLERTHVTVQLVLAALYPPVGEQEWNEKLKWNPIPYKIDTSEEQKVRRLRKSTQLSCEFPTHSRSRFFFGFLWP